MLANLENLISLSAAARLLPGHPSPTTLWRWYMHGTRGVKLQTWMVGARRYTTREALEAFIAATTAASSPSADDAPGERPEHVQRALSAAGVL